MCVEILFILSIISAITNKDTTSFLHLSAFWKFSSFHLKALLRPSYFTLKLCGSMEEILLFTIS